MVWMIAQQKYEAIGCPIHAAGMSGLLPEERFLVRA